MSGISRSSTMRSGGACVRCRRGKTKCEYIGGKAPCKNCAKSLHECILPSELNAHHHGQTPTRVARPRESMSGERTVAASNVERAPAPAAVGSRNAPSGSEKLTPELIAECERVINKTLPACLVLHKPSFIQKLKNGNLESSITNGLLTMAARSSPVLIRRYGGQGGQMAAAEHFAFKTASIIQSNLDAPTLADIQALCLLVIHEWGCRNAIRAYIYLGQAARMAQMYRIVSQHANRTEADQFIKDESFRRTLWLIYILDCFLTSSPGRHPALSAIDTQGVSLPCQDMSFNFGTPVTVRTLNGDRPFGLSDGLPPSGEVGEFGHIVMATQVWRKVIEMLTTVTLETFSEQQCQALENEIEEVRRGLPMHFLDKPGHINLHITMGSGYTYAMLHCLLHSATIMINRRRLLQLVTVEGFNDETWRMNGHPHLSTVDRVFVAAHSTISLLLALEANGDKDTVLVFPIVMLFSCFTAASTIAWFSLKGLLPANVEETTGALVKDAVRFLSDGADAWLLGIPWFRHLSVMDKVLGNNDNSAKVLRKQEVATSVKDEVNSQPDVNTNNHESNADTMDYERPSSAQPQDQGEGRGSEPPRRAGFTTINGGSAGASTPTTGSPAPGSKVESAKAASPAGGAQPAEPAPQTSSNDMSAAELCAAFERQLLELDDLAAFMGGGV